MNNNELFEIDNTAQPIDTVKLSHSQFIANYKLLQKKYEEYVHMKYMAVANAEGDNWIVASMGCSGIDDKDWYVTTDRIHCSENIGDAKIDAELIADLLNLFCNVELEVK